MCNFLAVFLSPICHPVSPYHKIICWTGYSDDNIVSQLVSKYMATFWLLFCHLMSPGVFYRVNIGFAFIKLTAYMVSLFIGILLQLFAVFFVTCCHLFIFVWVATFLLFLLLFCHLLSPIFGYVSVLFLYTYFCLHISSQTLQQNMEQLFATFFVTCCHLTKKFGNILQKKYGNKFFHQKIFFKAL